MSCGQVRGWLAAYIADTLGEEQRQQLRTHVRTCPGCRSWFWEQDPVLMLALGLPDVEPADDSFVDGVLAGIHQRRWERSLNRKKRLLRWAAAAAGVVLTLGGFFQWKLRTPPGEVVVSRSAETVTVEPVVEPFVEVEGEGVRVYQLASGRDSRVQVAFIVSPSVEL